MALVLEAIVWTVACTGVWLLTLSSVSAPELVVAVCAAVPCGVLAVAARRAVGGSWELRPQWTAWLVPLPVAVLADTLRLFTRSAGVLAGRRVPDGTVRGIDLPRDRPASRWRTRQASATGLVTAAPGTVVLDVDEESGRVLLHALGDGRPSMEEVVRR